MHSMASKNSSRGQLSSLMGTHSNTNLTITRRSHLLDGQEPDLQEWRLQEQGDPFGRATSGLKATVDGKSFLASYLLREKASKGHELRTGLGIMWGWQFRCVFLNSDETVYDSQIWRCPMH